MQERRLKMKEKLLIVVLLVIFSIGITMIGTVEYKSYAQKLEGFPFGIDPLSLRLSDEQETKIKALHDSFRKEVDDLVKEVKRAVAELKALWNEEDLPDAERVIAKTREIRSAQIRIEEKSIIFTIAMLEVLTPEQRKQHKALTATSPLPASLF